MSGYKRNQIEEAISGVMELRSQEPSLELRTRLKRLLDTDRALGRSQRSGKAEAANFAFYSAEPPGSGVEVWFSEYEAFALLNGLSLMALSWPQGLAVTVMRRVRPQLEKEHARILELDTNHLFDQRTIRANVRGGDMAFDNTNPVLLSIVTNSANAANHSSDPFEWAICRGPQKAMNFLSQRGRGAGSMFELVTPAHELSKALARTEPSRRGRG
jgi:hypothetical protein